MKALPRLNVRLYRIKEDVDVRVAPPGPLGEHFARELREVARVPGIKVETLAAPHRAELKRALQDGAARLNEVVAGCEEADEEEPLETIEEAEEPEAEDERRPKPEESEKPEKESEEPAEGEGG